MTTVFRLGSVDTDEAERFEREEPEAFAALDREAKRIIGGSWDHWWLKTPLPGVVWCNCPHMTGYDGLKVEDLTRADFEGRKRIHALVDFVRANMPGFEDCFVVDVAPQTRRPPDAPARRRIRRHQGRRDASASASPTGRARPRLLHAVPRAAAARRSRACSSPAATTRRPRPAQKMSREIPPCMAMGEAAGVAAALALDAGVPLRDVDVARDLQRSAARAGRRSRRPGPSAERQRSLRASPRDA